jgi:hypothetical protein
MSNFMSDRAKHLMQDIWSARNSGADTEEKLVAQTLKILLNYVTLYGTENQMTVLSAEDVVNLSNEVESLK